MSRSFLNVSPFGALTALGKVIEKGETLVVQDEAAAVGLAEQSLNWLEVHAQIVVKAAKKAVESVEK